MCAARPLVPTPQDCQAQWSSGFSMAEEKLPKAVNVNIGVLGHIDSGKTSLCRMLSTICSTASMDGSTQSKERGITLDLGFSSFSCDAPDHFKEQGLDVLQFCLVDCPGHASLIRTVIGGAQIIDLCMLVIDVNKGIQTQTAECLVVSEILANQLIIVLNKVDMIPAEKREKVLKGVIKKLRVTFAASKFGATLPFVCVAASPQDNSPPIGVEGLIELLKSKLVVPDRDHAGPFMFSFDHAFPIKGQGTVLTGTVLSGSVRPQQGIVVPALGEAGKNKKVRSLQMFKKPVQEAKQGDRVAMCVAALDSKELERGIIIGEKFPVPTLDACICVVHRLSYFKQSVLTKAKFHVTLGHQTVMATAHFFCPLDGRASPSSSSAAAPPSSGDAVAASSAAQGKAAAPTTSPSLAMGCGALAAETQQNWPKSFDFSSTYLHLDELFQSAAPVEYENNDGDMIKICEGPGLGRMLCYVNGELRGEVTELKFDPNSGRLSIQEDQPLGIASDSRSLVPLKDRDRVISLLSWLAQKCLVPGLPPMEQEPLAFVLLVLEKPVLCPIGSLLIASKLDFDIHSPNCRIAFFGRVLNQMDPKDFSSLRVVKMKSKSGTLERFDKQDRTLMICGDMMSADTDFSLFSGKKVVHEQTGAEGIIEGLFGQEGKFKVRFKEELKIKTDAKGNVKSGERISMYFKRFNFEKSARGFTQ
mmetsp:Transcript_26991/g.52112  ORF Transcript_26991/g.52112 Transcript_26991/m.52112 type:complete len:700 (+) Transcript_26991:1-2100(+)